MRCVALLVGLLLLSAVAGARQDDPRLDTLFEQLKAASGPAEAAPIEAGIWALWRETPVAVDAALMSRAEAAIQRRDYTDAMEALDLLVAREADFAEAWNKRATVRYLIGDYRGSVEDIRRTLVLEPRHFGALSGLGLIYAAIDEPEAAIRSFRAALAIHPFLLGAKSHIEMLEKQGDGEAL
jgi:tetratricopeptide (TPR) repeat protein